MTAGKKRHIKEKKKKRKKPVNFKSLASSGHSGALYTAAWARPVLGSAQAGRGLVQLHLLSGPDLSQKLNIIIAAKGHLSTVLPD